MGWGWALIWVWLGGRGGGRLLTFSTFRIGAYSRWALIRGWALIRINTVTHVQSHITRESADTCHDPGASLLGIIKIWNISRSTATNQSAWYNRLISEPRTLAPGIVSMLRACRLAIARVVDYFHIEDRASIPGQARTISCVHISSYGFQHSHSSMSRFHYSVEVLVTVICLSHS